MSLTPNILTVGTFDFYSVSQHGITFKAETPKGQWLHAVEKLCKMYENTEFAKQRTLMLLADALNWGEETYGEEFAQAIDNTREHLGLSPKTIANAAWVYGKIDASRRRDGLTLGHYSVIAGLTPEQQDVFMASVLVDHLTVKELKEEVATAFPKTKRGKKRKTEAKADDGDTAETVLHKLSDCANWLLSNAPTEKMKADMIEIYKVYRRKWQPGRKK